MRFFLDNDVPVSVGKMLRDHGHKAWTAANANLADEDQDDNLTIYAMRHSAVLITIDKEFSRRRWANAVGRHVQMRCKDPEAKALLEEHLVDVVALLTGREHITVRLSTLGVDSRSSWK